MQQNIVNIFKSAIAATALTLSLSANAVIISGTSITVGGKVVALQGLDWLSLDETRNLSRNTVQSEISTGSSYLFSSSDWRYASRLEVATLFTSLWGGTTQGWSPDNGDGSQWFDDNFGLLAFDTFNNTTGLWTPAQQSNTYDYANIIYGTTTECGANSGCWAHVADMDEIALNNTFNHQGWFHNYYGLSAVVATNTFTSGYQSTAAGSFLVRTSDNSIPEPSVVALMGLGLLGLGLSRRKMKK